MGETFENKAAPGISYFTPAQTPPAGTAIVQRLGEKQIPLLFQPIKIRGVEFHNRIFVSVVHCGLHPDD